MGSKDILLLAVVGLGAYMLYTHAPGASTPTGNGGASGQQQLAGSGVGGSSRSDWAAAMDAVNSLAKAAGAWLDKGQASTTGNGGTSSA